MRLLNGNKIHATCVKKSVNLNIYFLHAGTHIRANITAFEINTELNETLVMVLRHGISLMLPLQSQNWRYLSWLSLTFSV